LNLNYTQEYRSTLPHFYHSRWDLIESISKH